MLSRGNWQCGVLASALFSMVSHRFAQAISIDPLIIARFPEQYRKVVPMAF